MIKSASGIYIESQYITLVRANQETGGIEAIEVIPLDGTISAEKAQLTGLKQLKSSGSLKRGEPVSFAFQSEQSIFFQTSISPNAQDLHEALSWELTCRTDESPDKFAFSAVPLGDDHSLGLAYRDEDVQKYTKLLAKIGVKPQVLSVDVVALVNLLEKNYGGIKETILFYVAEPVSSVIYIKDGLLWDVRMIYGIDKSMSPADLVPQLLRSRNELRELWDIHDDLLTKMTGSLIANAQVRSELAKALPNCYELNCFESVANETGIEMADLTTYNPVIAVAAGLALSGVHK